MYGISITIMQKGSCILKDTYAENFKLSYL